MVLQQSGLDVKSEDDAKLTAADRLKKLQESGRNNEIIIAPGPVQKQLSAHEQRRLAQEQARRKAASRKVTLLGAGEKKKTGESKFATNYIIDNVIHATLQIERK